MASVSAQMAIPTPVDISRDLIATFSVVAPTAAPVNAACSTLVTAAVPIIVDLDTINAVLVARMRIFARTLTPQNVIIA